MNWLEIFVRRAFPNAIVQRVPHRNAHRVSIEVDDKTLLGDRDTALRRVAQALRPKFPPRRRLHWGRVRPAKGAIRAQTHCAWWSA